MRARVAAIAALSLGIAFLGAGTAQAATTLLVFNTGYSIYDNSPPGRDIAHPNALHSEAGGIGTFADPITVAAGFIGSTPNVPYGTIVYSAALERYGVVEDLCGACEEKNLDWWVDGSTSSFVSSNDCMGEITGYYDIIFNATAGKRVNPGPISVNDQCRAQDRPPVVGAFSPITATVGLSKTSVTFSVPATDSDGTVARKGVYTRLSDTLLRLYSSGPLVKLFDPTKLNNNQAGTHQARSFATDNLGKNSYHADQSFYLKARTSLTANATPEPVAWNGTVKVTGSLLRANWDLNKYTAWSGRSAALQRRYAGNPTWVTVSTVSSSSTGALVGYVKNVKYDAFYRFVYTGTGATASTASAQDYVDGLDQKFNSCTAARAAGYPKNKLGYKNGVNPEYAWYTDADHDGYVCEWM